MKLKCHLSYFSVLLFLFTSQIFSEETYIIRIKNPSEQFIKQCIDEKKFIASLNRDKHIDLVVFEDEYKLLSKQFTIELIETSSQIARSLNKSSSTAQGYHTYEQMVEELKNLEKEYPQICKLYDIGDSRGKEYTASAYDKYKHDIWAIKVSDNVDKDEDEPPFLYMANMHGWEIASVEVCLAVLNYYLKNYSSNTEIKDRVDNCEIWFVPLVNPDGHKVPQRKNLFDNNNNNKFDGNDVDGVDLNRNFTFLWGEGDASHLKGTSNYCGPSAGSELETKVMTKLFEDKRFIADISYHSFGELVIWPYGYATEAIAPDDSALSNLGKLIASKLASNEDSSKTYKPMKITGLYPATGSKEDYAYANFGTFSYCIELFDFGFSPSVKDMKILCEDNPDAALELVKRVKYATLTGNISDKSTKLPVEATIYIKEIDDTVATKTAWRAPFKSNKKFGRYYRFLMPGQYTVTISAPGYKDTTFKDIIIDKDKATILDISLSNLNTYAFLKKNLKSGVTITRCTRSGIINISFPDRKEFQNVEIYNTQGKLIKIFKIDNINNNVASLELNNLSNGMYYIKIRNATEVETTQFSLSR